MNQGISQLIFLALLVGIFYFILIRPQKKRVAQHQQLIDSLDVGDEIVTIGGLYGRIEEMNDDDVRLEVSPGTTLRFMKSAIRGKAPEPEDELDDTDEDDALGSTGDDRT